jgi:hypothetical protein
VPACGSKSLDARVNPSLVNLVRQSQLLNTLAAGWYKKLEMRMCVRCLNWTVTPLPGRFGAGNSLDTGSQSSLRPPKRWKVPGTRAIDDCISKPVKRNGICEAPRKWLAPRGIEDASSGLPAAALVQEAGTGDVPSS